MTITGQQVRAAGALLGWTRDRLAGEAGLSASTVGVFEGGKHRRSVLMVSTIQRTLEAAGVEFIEGDPGVRLRNGYDHHAGPSQKRSRCGPPLSYSLGCLSFCRRPGPIPTLASIRRNCNACPHHALKALAPPLIRWGRPDTSSQLVERNSSGRYAQLASEIRFSGNSEAPSTGLSQCSRRSTQHSTEGALKVVGASSSVPIFTSTAASKSSNNREPQVGQKLLPSYVAISPSAWKFFSFHCP
jgi:hypothetical protein